MLPNQPVICRASSLHLSSALPLNAVPNNKNAARDTRLAGRKRFYKQVGVSQVPPPWENDQAINTVESPVSAGVDDTQSASGVSVTVGCSSPSLLIPRRPGSSSTTTRVGSSWFAVTLDGRILKTPLGQMLAVPSQLLAWAIAAEWDAQEKYIQPVQMPLMTLTCTALDQTTTNSSTARQQVLQYLPTDTTCFYADPMEDRVLHRKQTQAWDGLHEYCANLLGGHAPFCAMGAQEAMLLSRARDNLPAGLPHPPQLVSAADAWVHSLDVWHLTALYSCAAEAKSFLLGMALVSSVYNDSDDGALDIAKAIRAARVEEELQIESWGLVEGGHDYDRLNCSVQMHSAQLMVSCIASDNEL